MTAIVKYAKSINVYAGPLDNRPVYCKALACLVCRSVISLQFDVFTHARRSSSVHCRRTIMTLSRVISQAMKLLCAFLVLLLALVHACMTPVGTPAYKVRSLVDTWTLTAEEEAFMAVPNNSSARTSLKYMTSKPHIAGTPGDHEMAKYVENQFIDSLSHGAGKPDVVVDPQKVLLSYPEDSFLELVNRSGHVVAEASLAESILPSDPTSDTWWRNHTFNSYSPPGNATAPVVYANFGLPEDFAALKAAGVSVEGAIVLMRYGKCFRGLKAMNAQHNGASAALIYSDPQQDGYTQGAVYPEGPWRPSTSVQRGSIQFISVCAGDPERAYRPHGLNVSAVCGKTREELIPSIPVLPLSWDDAVPFLASLGGPLGSPDFQADPLMPQCM